MAKRSIELYFHEDNRRIGQAFQKFREFKNRDVSKAREYFLVFKNEFLRHIALEEDVLFPIFEEKTALRDIGPTFVMRVEHRKIKEAIDEIQAKILSQAETLKEEEDLLKFLKDHDEKEEGILYPVLDELTSYVERDVMFTKIEELTQV